MTQLWLKFKLWLANPAENLWVQPTLGAAFALLFSILATISHYFMPDSWLVDIKAETLSDLLNIISGSMLAVTTFSLSIMVSALAATASSVTPRARVLVISDANTRTAITSFISAFIYAVIAKITLGLEYYGSSGRLIMFVGTLLVLVYLIFTLIRWIQTLSNLGSLGDTLNKMERSIGNSLANYRQQSNLGINSTHPTGVILTRISAGQTGYLAYIGVEQLNTWAKNHHCHIHITSSLNQLLANDECLFELYALPECNLNEEETERLSKTLRGLVSIQAKPNYTQDAVYGIKALAEVGQRALSPAVNDPETAVQTVSLITRLLLDTKAKESELPSYEHLSIVPNSADQFGHVYYSLARDGKDDSSFIAHILHCLAMLKRNAPETSLQQQAELEASKIYLMACENVKETTEKSMLNKAWQTYFPD